MSTDRNLSFKKEWTKNRKVALELYVSELKSMLRLADWNIEIDWKRPSEKKTYATIDPIEGQKFAIMRIGENFHNLTSYEQSQTIIHELIHCHLEPLTNFSENVVKQVARGKSRNLAMYTLNLHNEYATDGLADAFVTLLPKLVLPKKRRIVK